MNQRQKNFVVSYLGGLAIVFLAYFNLGMGFGRVGADAIFMFVFGIFFYFGLYFYADAVTNVM